MTAVRRIESELLDELPADNPRAIRSRQDLRLVNALMLQSTIMGRLLARHCEGAPSTLVDLGTGDGNFALSIARRMARRWPRVRVLLCDRQNIVSEETLSGFLRLGWSAERQSSDVFDFLDETSPSDVIMTNLFLHHFDDAALSTMLAKIARKAAVFAACEPRRGQIPLAGSRTLWAFGCNDVSRHDAVASVKAGFRGNELSVAWPSGEGWTLAEHLAIPFTHCFAARRGSVGLHR